MATSARTKRLVKYGICTNRDFEGQICPKCESKEKQEIPSGQAFECTVCHEKLTLVKGPEKKNGMLIGIIAAVAVVAILAGCYFLFSGNDEEYIDDELSAIENVQTEDNRSVLEEPATVATEETLVVVEENPAVEETPVQETKPEATQTSAPAQSASRSKDLGYATWKGALKNGKPNDENGTMIFKESHRIDSRDPQARTAEPGDYIIGEYVDGKLVQGVWYDKDNTVKGSIIIGR